MAMNYYTQCRSFPDGIPNANGILPCPGGLLNQSNSLMQAFDLLDRVIMRVRKDERANRGK